MENIIRISGLKKLYGSHEAVKGISFDVRKGDLFAFLGTNGAGKSTTINILTCLLEKTEGEVYIDGLCLGKDDSGIKERIGVVFQNSTLDDILTVSENLKIRASLYPGKKDDLKEKIKKAAQITGCEPFMDQRYGKLSGGQKRRADIACALIHEPKILFLDEPTTGLDPATRLSIWTTISEMQKKLNMTVFLTTHYMEEAAEADDVVVISGGAIVEHDTPSNLKKKYTRDFIRIYDPGDDLIKELNEQNISFTIDRQILMIPVKESKEAIRLLSQFSSFIESFEVVRGNMDDVFISITESLR